MHITNLLGVDREAHRGKTTAIETSTLMIDVLHHSVWWPVTMANSRAQAGHAACLAA